MMVFVSKGGTMLLYFSGTGNTQAVAKLIADRTGSRLFDMGAACRSGDFDVHVSQGEVLGFAFPTHRWSTPPLVDEFVTRMRFITPSGEVFKPAYCFTVETYGYFPGTESRFLKKLLQKHQGICVNAAYSVKSVGNCLYLFDTPAEDKVEHTLASAGRTAEHIAELVSARHIGDHVSANPIGAILSAGTGHEGKVRSVKSYNVLEDKCVGCGTCAAVCPTNTIHLAGGVPVWEGNRCTECLRCLHFCPKDASQYGKATRGRKRYVNPIARL